MNVFKITITSWTASFRYPNLISGVQPTLTVPPISTVLGLMNACFGEYKEYNGIEIGYYFEYDSENEDLETIYQFSVNDKGAVSNSVKSNIMRRKFLYNSRLVIYTSDKSIADAFRCPVFPILLGRSQDLASVDKIEKVELDKIEKADKIKGQIIPLKGNFLPGSIQALPIYFTNEIPRRNLNVAAFSVIPYNANDYQTSITAYRDIIDDNKCVDIYFHKINISDNR